MFEAVSFPFNEAATRTLKAVLHDVAKWDGKRKAWVMPAGTWSALMERDDLGAAIVAASGCLWSEVLSILEVMRGANVEPCDHMPEYRFVGGNRRFTQVR